MKLPRLPSGYQHMPAAATLQLPPWHTTVANPVRWPAIAPPARPAEPFTVESWVLVMQPENSGDDVWGNKMQLYSRTGAPTGPDVQRTDVRATGFTIGELQQPMRMKHLAPSSPPMFCSVIVMLDCPRRTFDPECTSWDVPVPLNDTCRQTVLWPKTFGEVETATPTWNHQQSIMRSRRGVNTGTCPPVHPFQPPTDGIGTVLSVADGPDPEMGRAVEVYSCSVRIKTGEQRGDLVATSRTAVWSQTIKTVWPPGTVAVLPVGPDATADGDSPDYPWRLNRAHVVTIVTNVPSTHVDGNRTHHPVQGAKSYSPLACGIEPYGSDHRVQGSKARPVFLDDAACVSGRSCRPDVGGETNASSPGYRRAVDEYVASNIAQLFPTGMVGCALAYGLDRETHTTDLLPVDMPLAQNGAGFTFASLKEAYWNLDTYVPATRGRWQQPAHNGSSAFMSRHRALAASEHQTSGLIPAANGSSRGDRDDYLQQTLQGALMPAGTMFGPYAVYRGPVPHRMLPPSPNVTLPPIQDGSWACGRTAPQGYFQERPYCLAVCDDPNRIAVDVGLEADAGLREAGIAASQDSLKRQGWALVASQARQWYSYWLGYPGLVQDEMLYQVDRLAQVPALGYVRPVTSGVRSPSYRNISIQGTSRLPAPAMRCMPDDDDVWSRSWSRQSRWAQRLPVSSAVVRFDLEFDRNTWPAALPIQPGTPPGLDYPSPSRQQLQWLEEDLEMDIKDLMGEPVSDDEYWDAVVRGVILGDPTPIPTDTCPPSLQAEGWCWSLPMRLSVEVILPTHVTSCEHLLPNSPAHPCHQRVMTAGAIAQRLDRALSQNQSEGTTVAGVWLQAVDPASVSFEVRLPCLPVFEYIGGGLCVSATSSAGVVLSTPSNGFAMVWLLVVLAACVTVHLLRPSTPRRGARLSHSLTVILCQLANWIAAVALIEAKIDVPGLALLCWLIGACFLRLGVFLWRMQQARQITAEISLVSETSGNSFGSLEGDGSLYPERSKTRVSRSETDTRRVAPTLEERSDAVPLRWQPSASKKAGVDGGTPIDPQELRSERTALRPLSGEHAAGSLKQLRRMAARDLRVSHGAAQLPQSQSESSPYADEDALTLPSQSTGQQSTSSELQHNPQDSTSEATAPLRDQLDARARPLNVHRTVIRGSRYLSKASKIGLLRHMPAIESEGDYSVAEGKAPSSPGHYPSRLGTTALTREGDAVTLPPVGVELQEVISEGEDEFAAGRAAAGKEESSRRVMHRQGESGNESGGSSSTWGSGGLLGSTGDGPHLVSVVGSVTSGQSANSIDVFRGSKLQSPQSRMHSSSRDIAADGELDSVDEWELFHPTEVRLQIVDPVRKMQPGSIKDHPLAIASDQPSRQHRQTMQRGNAARSSKIKAIGTSLLGNRSDSGTPVQNNRFLSRQSDAMALVSASTRPSLVGNASEQVGVVVSVPVHGLSSMEVVEPAHSPATKALSAVLASFHWESRSIVDDCQGARCTGLCCGDGHNMDLTEGLLSADSRQVLPHDSIMDEDLKSAAAATSMELRSRSSSEVPQKCTDQIARYEGRSREIAKSVASIHIGYVCQSTSQVGTLAECSAARFALLDAAGLVMAVVWGMLCLLGVCEWYVCSHAGLGTSLPKFRHLPQVLLLGDRLVVAIVPVTLAISGQFAIALSRMRQ